MYRKKKVYENGQKIPYSQFYFLQSLYMEIFKKLIFFMLIKVAWEVFFL